VEGDMTEHIVDEVKHPTVYHTPEQVKFSDIDIDTSQTTWVLHGISQALHRIADDSDSSDELTNDYDSTCNLEVTKRGMEIRPPEVSVDSNPRR
jgi:hypothetical protein